MFSGRVKPDSVDKRGMRTIHLWARVYDDASVEVASEPFEEHVPAMDYERLDALKAAVRTMAPLEDS